MLFENIKKLCEDRGVSLYEVERSSGLSPRTIYKWGESAPSVERVKAVADFFGVTVDDLLKPGSVHSST